MLFLDIETAPQFPDYEKMDRVTKALWDKKASFLKRSNDDTAETLYARAGIYAEFGRIICICAGLTEKNCLDIYTFSGREEELILKRFTAFMLRNRQKYDCLCAHNGKEFDFPYLCRRLIVHQLPIPEILDTAGKKPWEIKHLDTMELWKFGDWKNYTSLALLTHILNIPSPKQEMDGGDVGRIFWQEKGLDRIASYCQQDVVAVFRLMQRYQGEALLNGQNINFRD